MPELSKPAPGLTDMQPPALPEPPKLKPAVRKGVGSKQPQEMPRLTRAVHWQRNEDDDAYTSLHVNKEHKDVSGINVGLVIGRQTFFCLPEDDVTFSRTKADLSSFLLCEKEKLMCFHNFNTA